MNKYCTFYVVRHGQTEWNVQGRYQGQKDSPLTEMGLEQASVLAKKLSHIRFDAAFSSDLLRAQRTAEVIALEHKLAVSTTKALRERSFGSIEGKTEKEIREELREVMEKYDMLSDEEKFTYRFVDDMETDDEIATRMVTYVREMAVGYAGKTVLLVCHGGIMRSFLIKIGHATYESLPRGKVANTAYFKMESDGVDFFVKETSGIDIIA